MVVRSRTTTDMNHRDPRALLREEWEEIASIDFVRESWGLSDSSPGVELSASAYGARFGFVSGIAPGYVGDLYVIHGDSFAGPPMTFTRDPVGNVVPGPTTDAA